MIYLNDLGPRYAGIGSRETPVNILVKMQAIASVFAEAGYVLRSGKAKGADSAFESGCDIVHGKKQIFTSQDATDQAIELALKYHPNPEALKAKGKYVLGLMGRNMQIISGLYLNDNVDFVVCWTKDGKDTGGTGQAIRYCWDKGIKVYNLFNADDLEDLRIFYRGVLKAQGVSS